MDKAYNGPELNRKRMIAATAF